MWEWTEDSRGLGTWLEGGQKQPVASTKCLKSLWSRVGNSNTSMGPVTRNQMSHVKELVTGIPVIQRVLWGWDILFRTAGCHGVFELERCIAPLERHPGQSRKAHGQRRDSKEDETWASVWNLQTLGCVR